MLNRVRQFFLCAVVGVSVFSMASCALFESKEVSQGRKLFSFYCAHCHGEKGNGRGFNADNLDPHPRDLTDRVEPYMAEATNEDIFKAIKDGLAGVVWPDGEIKVGNQLDEDYGFGSTLMPYWGYTFSEDELWSLVAFVRSLHKNDAEKVELPGGEADEGKKIYAQVAVNVDFNVQGPERERLIQEGSILFDEKYACLACHSVGGEGGHVGPDLSRAGFRFNSKWIFRWIKSASSIKHDTKMPDFAMPDEDALAITLYLSTFKAPPDS